MPDYSAWDLLADQAMTSISIQVVRIRCIRDVRHLEVRHLWTIQCDVIEVAKR